MMTSSEEQSMCDDPKYRQYINAVDKCLRNFESSSEWADLISALGKLNKVLNPKFKVIPKKITVGKRLAQCMHPALPGGVHLKAITVYDSIFKIIAPDLLKVDLYVYSMGIFPLFANASLQVRPVLLNLYETHILSLGESLRSSLDGLILGLLPGLDEGTEHFDRTDLLLERVCERVGALDFYSAVWRCILSSTSARLSAVQLILRRYNRKRTTEDQLYIIGSDLEVMVTALCHSLQDNLVLTQRASLDVLIFCCPLSNLPVLYTDACMLLEAALQCLLRRDMSLNRRLYSWLLGMDQSKQSSVSSLESTETPTYFENHSKQLLVESLQHMLDTQAEKMTRLHYTSIIEELFPLRILVSLLDKSEVGPVIIESVLLQVFRLLEAAVNRIKSTFQQPHDNEKKNSLIGEVCKTANLLLGVFEPGYIWKFLSKILFSNYPGCKEKQGGSSLSESCRFVHLLLTVVDLESYIEIQTISLPALMCNLAGVMREDIANLTYAQLYDGLTTCNMLLEHSQPVQPSHTGSPGSQESIEGEDGPDNSTPEPLHDSSVSDCANILLSFLECLVELKLNGTRDNIRNYLKILEASDPGLHPKDEQQINFSIESPEASSVSDPEDSSVNVVDIFNLSCSLLLNFACFPVYCNGQMSLSDPNKIKSSLSTFPAWLQSLLWCACGASHQLGPTFVISSTAVSTILDLIALTQSIPHDTESDCSNGIISVKVLSPITPAHIHMLTEETNFYQLLTKQLWMVLGEDRMYQHHLTSVQLLLRLHFMAPDSRCEDAILADIIHQDKKVRFHSLQKFCKLWHLTRVLASQKTALHSGTQFKAFNRCLFSVVDYLSLDRSHLSSDSNLFQLDPGGDSIGMTTASSWLRRSLEEKDLSRILEPFLMLLLHPSTHSSPEIVKTSPDGICEDRILNTSTSSDHVRWIDRGNISMVGRNDLKKERKDGLTSSLSSVTLDISSGRQKYNELLRTLTTDAEHDIDQRARMIVEEVIGRSCRVVSALDESTEPATASQETAGIPQMTSSRSENTVMGPFLVYQEKFDASRVSYALRSILSLFHTHPRLFAYIASTQHLATSHSPTSAGPMLQELLARHLQSIGGASFYGDVSTRCPNIMILEALIIIALRYIRSWNPLGLISFEPLHDVRSVACTFLVALLDQMTNLARDSMTSSTVLTSSNMTSSSAPSQQFGAYVWSLLEKHRVIEVTLRLLSATVDALRITDEPASHRSPSNDDLSGIKSFWSTNTYETSFHWAGGASSRVQTFQTSLLSLVRGLLVFQHHLNDSEITTTQDSEVSRVAPTYHPQLRISLQPLLTSSIIRVLSLQTGSDVHGEWLDFVTSSLPYLSHMLPEMTSPITLQLCRNLKEAAAMYGMRGAADMMPPDYVVSSLKSLRTLCHFTLLLHVNTAAIKHNVFSTSGQVLKVDRAAQLTAANTAVSLNQASNVGLSALSSLFNVFSVSSSIKTQRSVEEQELANEVAEARRVTLRNLPRILSCVVVVWHRVVSIGNQASKQLGRHYTDMDPCVAMGGSESVSQNLLQLLNPLAIQYGENLLGAFAVVWERRQRTDTGNKSKHWFPLPEANTQQQQVLDVACAIRSLQCDVLVSIVKRVILQPDDFPMLSTKRRKQFQESLLDFTLRFVQRQQSSAVRDAWPNLLSLVRECLALGSAVAPLQPYVAGSTATLSGKRQISASCHFILLLLVSEYARRTATSIDKKDQKDLQDICVRCIEACNTIVDCSLEHGGWLARRAPSVLPGPHQSNPESQLRLVTESGSSVDLHDKQANRPEVTPKSASSDPGFATTPPEVTSPTEPPNPPNLTILPHATNPNFIHSLHALNVLAQVLANLLDVIYGSEEKEKIVPVLMPVIANVTPYLRDHSANNSQSYKAAVRLLSSVSGYQQTRRAWKRDAFDLLMEPDFFRMPPDCATEWRNVVDHLMTHDATTFKDLMVRIGLSRNAATGPSLNIFSNKEQELEQRAMLLKRLAFVVFSSDSNQYQRHLPEIQERLSESLKLHQVPTVQAQVFLCFRVLLLRVSPSNLQSLWPSIVTELVQVLSQLEDQLTMLRIENDHLQTSEPESVDPAAPSSGGGIFFSNQPNSQSGSLQEKWMTMYLSACKLLDLILCLQPHQLNHFKLFRWSFVGEPGESTDDVYGDVIDPKQTVEDGETTSVQREFVPHCVRIKRLLARKTTNGGRRLAQVKPLRPLLEIKRLTSLWELQEFFNTLVEPRTMLALHGRSGGVGYSSKGLEQRSFRHIETILQNDFVEPMT